MWTWQNCKSALGEAALRDTAEQDSTVKHVYQAHVYIEKQLKSISMEWKICCLAQQLNKYIGWF